MFFVPFFVIVLPRKNLAYPFIFFGGKKMAEEKILENKIKKFLKEKNIFHFKFFANACTAVGIPDIVACINGRFTGIEVKAEKGQISVAQLIQAEKIKENGGLFFLVRPSNFEEFKKIIENMLQ